MKFMSPKIPIIILMKDAGLLHSPCGMRLYSCSPRGVVKAVYFLSSSCIGMLKKPEVRSIVLKRQLPPRAARQSDWCGKGWASFKVRAFSHLKSVQIRNPPSFFHTITSGEAYSLEDFLIIPFSSISVRTCLNF